MDPKCGASPHRWLLNLSLGLRMLDKQRRPCTRPQNAWAAGTGPNAGVPPILLQPLGNEIHGTHPHSKKVQCWTRDCFMQRVPLQLFKLSTAAQLSKHGWRLPFEFYPKQCNHPRLTLAADLILSGFCGSWSCSSHCSSVSTLDIVLGLQHLISFAKLDCCFWHQQSNQLPASWLSIVLRSPSILPRIKEDLKKSTWYDNTWQTAKLHAGTQRNRNPFGTY